MRVIAGTAKGRKLRMREGLPVRPTGDKVKGAVFNILAPLIPGCSFLDLFAGSGAMGIEAWSRGAESVVFVEKDRRVYVELLANLREVGFSEAQCINADYAAALLGLVGKQFDVIYVDPPYQAGLYEPVLAALARSEVLAPAGILCLEHPRGWRVPEDGLWRIRQQKNYGDTGITILERN